MRKFFTYLSLPLIFIGVAGCVFNMTISSLIPYKGELPLHDIQGIVAKHGKIYVGLGYHSRIQVYTADGKYVGFQPAHNYRKRYIFSISRGVAHVERDYLAESLQKEFPQPNGDIYYIQSKIPFVIGSIHDGHRETVISQPIWVSPWAEPFHSWLIAFSGVLIFLLANHLIVMDVYGSNISSKQKRRLLIQKVFKKSPGIKSL